MRIYAPLLKAALVELNFRLPQFSFSFSDPVLLSNAPLLVFFLFLSLPLLLLRASQAQITFRRCFFKLSPLTYSCCCCKTARAL